MSDDIKARDGLTMKHENEIPRQPCPSCHDRGWVLWIYPNRRPWPAWWFQRGPNNEKPSRCDDCTT